MPRKRKQHSMRIRVESTDSILENISETTGFDTFAGAVSTTSTTVTTMRPVTTKKSTTPKITTTELGRA